MPSTPASPAATTPTISHPAHTILSKTHAPAIAAKIFTDKIKNKPLLLTPSGSSAAATTPASSDKRALRRKIREHKQRYKLQHQKPRPLSAKEKRTLKIYDLQPHEVRYDIYKGLNGLWLGYILEVLGFTRDGETVSDAQNRVVSQASHGSLLASADFHGMEVEVVRCVDVGRIGLKGIVVRETKGTLLIVTEKNQQRRISKRGTVFKVVFGLPGGDGEIDRRGESHVAARRLVFELHGDQLEFRPVDRAARKFKWKSMDRL